MAAEGSQTVTLSMVRNYEFTVSFDRFPDAPPLLMDEPPPLGDAHGPNASAVLASAVGNCLAASLAFCLRRSRAEVRDLGASVKVSLSRNEAGRLRVTGIEVELSPEVGPDDLAKLKRCEELFEDFCVVTASIRKGIPVSVSLQPAVPRETP